MADGKVKPSVTICIKALNEEAHIAAALQSALAAVAPFGGAVVLADSGSTDRTVEIAQKLPVRVLQLADPGERCCGAGAQLAFQGVETDYFVLMDGDMVLLPGFLEAALAKMEENPRLAGVGGEVIERDLSSLEFQVRAAEMGREAHRRPGAVDRLDGGGLFRTAAIRDVGYFADRNLRSFEEFELAGRLWAKGWTLARIAMPAVAHTGHSANGYRLMLWRFTSGQLSGAGAVLRSALGRPQLPFVLRRLKHLRSASAVWLWWLLLIAALVWMPVALIGLLVLPFAYLCWRRGGVRLGLFSLFMWNLTALGALTGLFARRVSPARPLDSIEIGQSR